MGFDRIRLAVVLLLAFVNFILVFDTFSSTFGLRAEALFGDFIGLVPIFFPLAGVLLAVRRVKELPEPLVVGLEAVLF